MMRVTTVVSRTCETRANRSRVLRNLVSCFSIVLLVAACASHDRSAVTPSAASYESFAPIGVPDRVRYFADTSDLDTDQMIAEFQTAFARTGDRSAVNMLALSGGGPDGAYGAGVLNGWTATGNRPEFDVVTGISTGAIIAPFAFLGSDYDGALRRFYTSTDTRRVARFRVVGAVLAGGALADNAPLEEAIARELTDDLIRKIAVEHQKGRRLLIGTTNIDAERPVLWDVGALASSGAPGSYDLVRKIILASAAIPVFFKPVRIPVTDGREIKEELHVDGALTQQIFTYPVDMPVRRVLSELGLENKKNTIWLIHNKRLEPRFEPQSTRLVKMAERTLTTLIRSQGFGDLAIVIALAKRDGFEVNGLAVPGRFKEKPRQAFDPAYMTRLYNEGVADGLRPGSWQEDLQDDLFGDNS